MRRGRWRRKVKKRKKGKGRRKGKKKGGKGKELDILKEFINFLRINFSLAQELVSLSDEEQALHKALTSPSHSPASLAVCYRNGESTKVLWNSVHSERQDLVRSIPLRCSQRITHSTGNQDINLNTGDPCWGIWCCHWQKVSAPGEKGGSLGHAK